MLLNSIYRIMKDIFSIFVLMKNCYKTLSIYFLFLSNLYSQKEVVSDSLSKYSYSELSNKFYAAKKDSIKAVLYANKYISKAQKINDTIEIGNGYYYLSDITKDSSHFLDYWNNIIEKSKVSKNNFYTGFSNLQIGDYHFQFGNKSLAIENYLQANKLVKNDSLKYIIFNRIGMFKKRNGDIVSAISYFKKSYNYVGVLLIFLHIQIFV